MLYFLKFVYNTFLLPPGIFIIILAGYCIRQYWKQQRVSHLLLVITAFFYLLSTSLVGDGMVRTLEERHTPPSEVQGDVIVMLGGGALPDVTGVHGLGQLSGSAANRLLTTAQLYHRLQVPVLVSGGQVYQTGGAEAEIAKSILISLGVPAEKIIVEGRSRNTTENAIYSKQLMEVNALHKPILVTSAFHMERAIRQFNKIDIQVLPYPTDYQAKRTVAVELAAQLYPSAAALQNVSLAIKEYIGILVSRWY